MPVARRLLAAAATPAGRRAGLSAPLVSVYIIVLQGQHHPGAQRQQLALLGLQLGLDPPDLRSAVDMMEAAVRLAGLPVPPRP